MPKINKTHTPQSPRLVAQRYDNLFKYIISSGWGVKSDGSVEAASHFFAMVEIPSHPGERKEMHDALFHDEQLTGDYKQYFGELPPGWYFTVEDEFGLIWVYEMRDKADAEHAYEAHEKIYQMWCERIESEV